MKSLFFIFLFLPAFALAQIVGTVTDENDAALAFVNVFVENTYIGTTSNENGLYALMPAKQGELVVVFQSLGYKTLRKRVEFTGQKQLLNVKLEAENLMLDEVVVSNQENPANQIIRNAIDSRQQNLNRISAYTADFYSRGLWKMQDVPERILGQQVGDFEGALDSTRSGIVYLSETMSKIAYRRPNDFFEKIIASKVSGNDNGFSFNSAQDANFSFYENTLSLNAAIVSPIANNAFSYYRYSLDGVFYENNQLINRIRVTPRRPNDRVFEGVIYIVENSWQIYGAELATTGTAIQVPMVEDLVFTQNFSYDADLDLWVKRLQIIDFSFNFLGFKGEGRFTAVYSNYNFEPVFDANSFSNMMTFFEPNANKKDSVFWESTRPVPLTIEEQTDYIRRDSIQLLRQSKTYLDSVDRVKNRFKMSDPIMGYSYANSYQKWRLSYEGLFKNIQFNTLQGWNVNTGLNFSKAYDENRTRMLWANAQAQYGFADKRLRFEGRISKRFNRFKNNTLSVSGGNKVQQFNRANPISPLINTVSSLFFERNFLKAYDLTFIQASYSQELVNGWNASLNLAYEDRKPLFNTSSQVIINNSGVNYTSNNPLEPDNFDTAAIDRHSIFVSTLGMSFRFGQKYLLYPDAKYNVPNEKYPVVNVFYTKGFGASQREYNFDKIHLRAYQNFNVGSLGNLNYNLRAGTFFNADSISFADFQHFNGNQTRIGTSSSYTNVFNLLPYYELSTNKSYFEAHLEHDFRGFVLGKIPGINQLNYNLVIGAHLLATENNKPYSELSVGLNNMGFGKFRFLRLDYVHSFYNGNSHGAFIFGLRFLNVLN